MAERIVTVDVDKDGNMEIDAAGFKGKGCSAVMKAFEEAGKVTKETFKPEYYEGGAANKVSTGR